ncbi:biotin/lipoyl-containing protein [Rhodococcus opacus]|uniref:biotin/lipoyl-containing protein n=1 Tax=Rhodococcus opacus TaxID=37919 RepID=UPI0002D9B6B0|nr:biotin/lipoyl-containing protein [Rhodococcus opacus]MDX5962759.1 biotin/lipoyl-containing protein [Rhodococcus opacus]CAG7638199.1 hypothetical protein E143388_07973 [Rhodococcus opacus]
MPEAQMPRLSDTMTEGILSRWLKNEGDLIRKGDIIAEIETDKATMELEAYDEGPLTALLVTEGSTVHIGQPIAIIGESASAKPTSPAPQAPTRAEPSASKPSAGGPATAEAPEPATPSRRATPLVRKIAHERGIDLGTVTGTGPGGRIVRADVEPAVGAVGHTPQASVPVATTPATIQSDDESVPLTTFAGSRHAD